MKSERLTHVVAAGLLRVLRAESLKDNPAAVIVTVAAPRCDVLRGFHLSEKTLQWRRRQAVGYAATTEEIRQMPARSYSVIYEPAEEGGFYAHIPALEITTEGETIEEAKEMARDAIENTLACLEELDLPIPEEVGCEQIEVRARRRGCHHSSPQK